jgi:small conductance mechanosensitive channel
VITTLGYIAITVLHFLIKLFAKSKNKRRKTIITLIASLLKYTGYLFIIILLFNIWQLSAAILAAIIASLGIAVGFGAQGIISDLLTGVFLIFENSLHVGDIITVEGFRGEVEEIGIRTTKFTSATGDVKVINNSELKRFINMSVHRSMAICNFTIEYGENLKRVEEFIAEKIEEIASSYEVITDGPYYIGVVEFNERGVMLRIIAKCEEAKRMQLERDLNREFKLHFDANQIRLAIPTLQLEKQLENNGGMP